MKLVLLAAMLVPNLAFSAPEPAQTPVQALTRQAFAGAKLCHVHSVLYGQILDARKGGAEKSFIEKKLNVASSPLIAPLINSAYDGPADKTQDPEAFYAECATKMQDMVVKRAPALTEK